MKLSILQKLNKGTLISFAVFIFATASQFIFDTIGSKYVPEDIFREIITWRSLLIIVAPLVLLGFEQSIIRFTGIPSKILRILNATHIIITIILFILLLVRIISFDIFLFCLTVILYVQSLMISSFLRISNRAAFSQIMLNGWKVIIYSVPLIFFYYSECDYKLNENNSAVSVGLLFVASFILIFFLKGKESVVIYSMGSLRDFITYSLIFAIFIGLLAFSQYFDQLVAAKYFDINELKRYIFFSAFYIAPTTIVATFIGFIITPKFVKMDIENIKLSFWKYFSYLSFLYPIMFLSLYLIEFLLADISADHQKLSDKEYLLFFLLGYFRFIYVLMSAIMGMKSDKSNLMLFFFFCFSGILVQILVLATTFEYVFMSMTLLQLSVLSNWIFRNSGALYIILRKL